MSFPTTTNVHKTKSDKVFWTNQQ